MTLLPTEHQSRLIKYAPFMNPSVLGLSQWGIEDAQLTFISDTENIIFRADTPACSYCVRICPNRSRAIPEIYGELHWLIDIRHRTDLLVPNPLMTSSGHFVHEAYIPEFDASFYIVLFDWLSGHAIDSNLNIDMAQQLGGLMAELHTHSSSFDLPAGSFRDMDDWQGMGDFFIALTPIEIARIESFLTAEQIDLCQQVAQDVAKRINQVAAQQNFGLIHSDLHAKNCLWSNDQIAIIDFDDCQFAPFSCDMAITFSSFADFEHEAQLQMAFLQGYSDRRDLPTNYMEEIESFRIERQLRLIRWVSKWPSIDHFSFGRPMIENILKSIRRYR